MHQQPTPTDDLTRLLPDEEEKDIIRDALTRLHTPCPDIDREWERMKERIDRMDSTEPTATAASRLAPTLRLLLAVAACAAALFLLWPTSPQTDNRRELISYEQQTVSHVTITTGGNTATLPQGQASFLQSATTDGQTVAYEMVAVKTPRGKECRLTLSDGTRVWLNGESVLEFPERFTGHRREVSLHGEAYFEVAKDRQHPFIVKSRYYTATVLGTSFNATAYSEQDASIALVEGKVKVCDSQDNQEHILTPGHLLTLTADHTFKLTQTDTYPYTQRKDGFFYYDNATLRDIMLDLGRWYNKTVVFEDEKSMDMRLHFVAERKESLVSVLRDLASLTDADIHLNEQEIIIR